MVVIINPISGAGRRRDVARRRAEQAAALLDARRLRGEIFVTERQGHARELAAAALGRGATQFVAWGGDGTVNEVASAIVRTDASLAIVPSGSGNGLARDLGIPLDPEGAFRVALDGKVRVMDAGEVDGRLFFNIAGFGLDARVAHRFAEGGLERRGFARYLEIAAREIFTFAPVEYTVTTDGRSSRVLPMLVVIANARQYGNGAVIAPDARIDDGWLDVVTITHRSPLVAVLHARRLFTGTVGRLPGVSITRAEHIELAADTPLVYHLDGEPHIGGLSVKARVMPSALRVHAASG